MTLSLFFVTMGKLALAPLVLWCREEAMKYQIHQHRFAEDIVNSNPELKKLWIEITETLDGITDDALIAEFTTPPEFMAFGKTESGNLRKRPSNKMSLSAAINNLIDDGLVSKGWNFQSKIFQGKNYDSSRWRLDFSKRISNPHNDITGIAIEVAFNHGEAIAWNLMKPTLAAEINHVETEIEIGSGIGVYICPMSALRKSGAFDNTVGTYEKVLRYLNPLHQKITVPMLIVGLEEPESFSVEKVFDKISRQNEGKILYKPEQH